jgi:hypothetical protein
MNTEIPKGHPDILAGGPEYKVTYDTAKERRVLGVGYRTKEQTVKDTLADFKVRGW